MLHRIRSRLIANRTPAGNQIRGLLAEYGIIVPLHFIALEKARTRIDSRAHPQLTAFAQELFAGLYEELCQLDDRIRAMEERIQEAFRADEACQRIACIEGGWPCNRHGDCCRNCRR